MRTIVLGSTSVFRKAILEKLQLPFECAKPNIDETPIDGESPIALVERLAVEKAKAVASQYPDALIIGSDQVALHNGQILGKPHTHDNAIKQLSSFSGNKVVFYTGLCIYDSASGEVTSIVEPFYVHFKELKESAINHYLLAEQPYKCAGSFKSEGLGICLFNKLEGDDPNTLIGLPLIKLTELLAEHGVDVLANQSSNTK
jgi:MAF protein